MKAVKKPVDDYRRFDNPLLAVAALWTATRPGDVPGLSREECVLAALAAARVYAESVLRADGVSRERVAEVLHQGHEIGDAITEILGRRDELNIPPTAGLAGDIMTEMLERKLG